MAEEQQLKTLGKGFHLAHLNVRSLLGKNKADMLKQQIQDSNVNIFTLSETWLSSSIPDAQVGIHGYAAVRLDRDWGGTPGGVAKKGGGVMCYIKDGINYSDEKYKECNISCADLEMQWVLLTIQNLRPIVVVNVYRPPQGDYKKGCTLISEAFDRANLRVHTDIFLMGDFNINLNEGTSLEAKELDFTTNSLGLRQVIKEPTRISFRNGARKDSKLDLIFTNSEVVKEAATMDLNISDHLAVFVTRKKAQAKVDKVEFRGRSYRNYSRENFQDRLTGRDWGEFFESRDPDLLCGKMENIIQEEIERMCPIKSFKVAAVSEPWITNEALEAIKDKDRLLRKAKRSGLERDWEEAKRVRNRVGRDLEIMRADFLKQQQQIHRADPKKFWSTVSSIIPGNRRNKSSIWLTDKEKGKEVPQEQVPDFINTFFTGIGPKLAKGHKVPWVYNGQVIREEMGDMITNLEEVTKLCKEINPMKSSGIDNLSSRICKDAFMVLTDRLLHVFNCSLSTNKFPAGWKQAKVVPLHKGGESDEVGNYRPVSLLPLPGKLLEKVVHTRISSFLETQNFLSQNQGGFRKGYSTLSTVAELTDDLYDNINQGMTTLAAFIDLRKAFDTVNLDILKNKLERAGIRNNAWLWCADYLAGREQRTIANGITSNFLPVTCGVPQGSVLGPLFFLVYVNDLDNMLQDCKVNFMPMIRCYISREKIVLSLRGNCN